MIPESLSEFPGENSPYWQQDKSLLYKQLLMNPNYQQRVKQIAYRHTRGTSVSWEDAAQTAHEKVFQALQDQRFDPEKGNFYHWAATVAKFAIIDLMRKEKRSDHTSLDRNIPGTDIPLLDSIPDAFNLLDALERTDLVFRVREAIALIDERYPGRGYGKLWQGKVHNKTQTQLANELGITQSAISKRWKELIAHVAQELGLLPNADTQREDQGKLRERHSRTRSNLSW